MFDKRTRTVIFTILVFAAGLAVLYLARRPLLMLVFATLFAYLLEPVVMWFQVRFRGSRTLGIAVTYLILGGAISIAFSAFGPRILVEGKRLGQSLPALMEDVGSGQIAQQIGARQGWDYETQLRVQRFLADNRATIDEYVRSAGVWAAELAGNLLWVVLIPLFAVFILKDKSDFGSALITLTAGRNDRRFLRAVMNDLDVMLSAFIRAQLSLAGLSLIAYTVFLAIAQFPFSFVIGAVAGVLEFIPLVGPLISAIVILGLAFLTSYNHWLAVLVFLVIWRLLQDYVSSPLLMGRGLKLHPFAVILGVMIGGEVAGVAGIFLSVPVMAGLGIVWRNWRLHGQVGELEAVGDGTPPL